jgi:hypothetical protein
MEALVPSSPTINHASQTPQKLNGNKDVHFFRVGTLHGRTLVIYMKKKHVCPHYMNPSIMLNVVYNRSIVYSVYWSQSSITSMSEQTPRLALLLVWVSERRVRNGSESTEYVAFRPIEFHTNHHLSAGLLPAI